MDKLFKIRASQCGKIMGNAKAKGELSSTCKSYLEEWYSGDYEPIKSKYMDKGNWVENDLIDFMSWQLGLPGCSKNVLHVENEHMVGTADVIFDKGGKRTIVDVKASWSLKTLQQTAIEGANPDYLWQGRVYMALFEADEFVLFHGLLDTPADVNYGIQVSYEHLPDEQRWVAWKIQRDLELEQQIVDKVVKCREWLYEYDALLVKNLGKIHTDF